MQSKDLPILCERFTTSKLKEFDDLLSIGTYGFRGEALASISHVAHLKVTTRTADSSNAWQAQYADGKLIPAKSGQENPKRIHGKIGTQLTVEDLFYNIPIRRRSFRSPSEEYAKILDVVAKHAVHCAGVGFSIKKHGDPGVGFAVKAEATTLDRIRTAHGAQLARELLEFEVKDDKLGFEATGLVSNANYNVKKTTLLLFINHRSVDSSAIKKAVEQTYAVFLPKGGHPFVYLSIQIEPNRVDVNIHPTKREVHFLNEDEIIDSVCSAIQERLAQVDASRTFKIQTIIPSAAPIGSSTKTDAIGNSHHLQHDPHGLPSSKRPYENNLVRTDSKMRKITSMLPPSLTANSTVDDVEQEAGEGMIYERNDKEQVPIRLTSIKNLRAEVREQQHEGLTDVFGSLIYVGVVDGNSRLVSIQSGVRLYLVDYGLISNEFFYQVGLSDFGNFGRIKLKPSPDLREILNIAATVEKDTRGEDDAPGLTDAVEKVFDQLMSRRTMLEEYFSIDISDEGELLSIPLLLKGYMPCLAKLPTFLYRLGPYVSWTSEMECFQTLLVELASFYTPEQLPALKGTEIDDNEQVAQRRRELDYALEHVLFPAFRSRFLPTLGSLKGVLEIADLKGLYKVFERC